MATLETKYRKQTHREHILSLPDTYIGSIETANEDVFLRTETGFEHASIAVNPGFYKLVDELLVNAHDHVVRLRTKSSPNPVKHIRVAYTDGILEIENDGEPIDVAKHPQHDMYIPQLIFGELLTSTNYDKEEKKLVGGKNGYGVKLVNIFAKQLSIHVVDAGRGLSYDQSFHDNMTRVDPPKVKASKSKSSVCLRWLPDYPRFGYSGRIPEGMVRLLERRVYDLAMTVGKDVKVTWNGELVKCRSLLDYAKAYGCDTLVHESPNDRWDIVLTPTPADGFFQSSFVNGIWTSKGGTHVDAVTNQVVTYIVDYLETKKKCKVKPSVVREHLGVFVVCLIENPSFTSQTKECLTTKVSAFGSSPKLSDDTLKKVVSKLGILEAILAVQAAKDAKDNTKTDGKKQSRITGIPKLDDAIYAGTTKSSQCTLILTEGDSAKTMAVSGLSQEQRKFYGIYPLRGKILNVKDTSDSKVEQTKEIAELKKIIGLQSGKKYDDVASLRYGSVMIMTDQDYDGSHIRGLLINLFHELWHELIAIPGFLTYMATPIVKATKGKAVKCFYTQTEYEDWRKGEGAKGWTVKYYKGLGTSTKEEAKEYFAHPAAVRFDFTPGSDEAIDLAFNKQRADDRKSWLQGYDKSLVLTGGKSVPYPEFVHKDLIHFSNYNLERAIPSVMDGLKVSQRKILYAAFKRNLSSEIKVAQFAGYVSEHTAYHHGEQSLGEAITGMAQTFVGANNIAWLVPQGQFGTRLQGGKDAASPRYIFTYLQPQVRKLVPAEDFPVLTYRDDDGQPVEPEWYAPVLPMLLVNGARGIGTGYSTYIPPYNPKDLQGMLTNWLNGDYGGLDRPLTPFFQGFKGEVRRDGSVVGVYRKEKDGEFVVTELPPGTWTMDYREFLEKELAEGRIKDFTDMSTDTDVLFRIKGMDESALVKSLTDKVKTTNMHAFNAKGQITKYDSPNAILKEYADRRLALYETRRLRQIADLQADLPYHEDVVRFIEDQIADTPTLNFRKKAKALCETELEKAGYRKISDSYDSIFRLPVSAFTAEEVAKHRRKLAEIRTEIARLKSLEAADIWLSELSAL